MTRPETRLSVGNRARTFCARRSLIGHFSSFSPSISRSEPQYRFLVLVVLAVLLAVSAPLKAFAGDTPFVGGAMFSTPQDCWAGRPAPQAPNFLGQGAFGQVFQLEDGTCIKIFKSSSTSLTCEMEKLQTTARCGGPRMLGLGSYNGRTGILMDLVPIRQSVAPFPAAFSTINALGPCAQQAVADSLAQFAHQGIIPDDFQGYLFKDGNKFKFIPLDCFCQNVNKSTPEKAVAAANAMLEGFFPDGPRIRPKPAELPPLDNGMRPAPAQGSPSRPSPARVGGPYSGSLAGGALIGASVQVAVQSGVASKEDLLLPTFAGTGALGYALGGKSGFWSAGLGSGLGLAGGFLGSAGASACGANKNQSEVCSALGSFGAGFGTGNAAAGVGNGVAIIGSYIGEAGCIAGTSSYQYGAGNFLWTLGSVIWNEGLIP